MGALIQGRASTTPTIQENIILTPAHAPPTATPARPAPAQPTTAGHVRPQRINDAQATDWYVDASVAASGDGRSLATAFKTIGEATAVAQAGDIIHVASGTYVESVSLPASVQLTGAGWRRTIVDGDGAEVVLYPGDNAVVESFTLRGSGSDSLNTAVWIAGGQVTLRNNRFTDNQNGVFLWCFESSCPGNNTFTNNIFDHNTGAGLATNGLHPFTATNNTFVYNGAALPATRDYLTLVNNVVVSNAVGLAGESGYTPTAHHNLVWGNGVDYQIVEPGSGDVNVDPCFVDPADGDYSLQLDSPGRDAGDPATRYEDLDGTRNDMGAFGGPFLIDHTLPPTPTVHDRGAAQPFTSTLRVTWKGYDLQSGITRYRVALGTTPGGCDTVDWITVGVTSAYTFTGLDLTIGATYYVAVRGQNGMGDWSAMGSSDGVSIDLTADDDRRPPLISSVAYSTPVHVASASTVTAHIRDQGAVGHGVLSATLFYGYDPPYDQVSVAGTGPGGDGNGRWRFTLPPQGEARAGQRLRFWVKACDGDDSPACTVDDDTGVYYPIVVSADLTPEPFRVDHSPELCDYPDIHGGRVVYEDHRGPGIEIYGWDLAADEEFQVIHDFHHQHFPVIHGDMVAYTDLRYSTTGLDGTDVFARDLSTGQEVTVTTAPGQQIALAIDDRYIVWEDDRDGATGRGLGSQRDIYGYELATGREFSIATGPASQITPDVDGSRIVWSEGGDIVGLDLESGERMTISTHYANQLRPVIHGDLVVWEDWRHGNWDLYGYRFSTGESFPIAIAPGDQTYPDLSDELIVWQDMRHGNWDVYIHVLETGEQFPVSRNARKQKWPAVDGTTVVWSDFIELQPQIYGFVYDGALPASADYAIEENPTDLVVGAIPGGAIPLRWQDHTDQETAYVIERQSGMEGLDYQTLVTLPAGTEAYTDTDTQVDTAYWYRVYARNEAGRSATTNESYNAALPAGPYPNEQERYMQVLINQVRANPAAFGYTDYPAVPPAVYEPHLNYAARAHATVSTLPGGSGGHVDWADRGPGQRAVASGYDHSYVSENMGSGGPTAADVRGANLGFLHSSGHRDNMLGPGTLETGLGFFYLWSERRGSWVETFGGHDGLDIPRLPAGAVAPFEGRPGETFTFTVNAYHPESLAPTAVQAVVDGVVHEMARAVGAPGNATYETAVSLGVGYDHQYYFQATFSDGTARLPESDVFSGPRVHGDGPDLDVTSLTASYVAGQTLELSAWVYNRGTVGAEDVMVRFYRGDPQDEGVPIGETAVTIGPGAGQVAEISWQPDITGTHHIYALADPDDQLVEWREKNNVRRTEVSLGRISFIYLPLVTRNQ